MKKIFNTVLALSLLTIPVSGHIFADQNSPAINVTIDGNNLTTDQPPVIQNGRTLVPLRSIFEALGAQVQWDQASQKITAVKSSTTLTLTVGSQVATMNDSVITLDQAPVIINGRTLVPVRFISESLGDQVVWNESTQTVTISSSGNSSNSTNQTVTSATYSENNQSTPTSQTGSSNTNAQSTQTSPTSFTSPATGVTSTTTSSPTVNLDVSQLTYQQALDMANATSYTLKSAQTSTDIGNQNLKQAASNVNGYTPALGSGTTPSSGGNTLANNTFSQYAQAQIAQQTAYKNLQKSQDAIAYQVKQAYNAVLLAVDNKKLADIALNNAQVQYQVSVALHQNGMSTDADLLKASNAVDAATATQQQDDKAISDAYQAFNNLVGLQPDARPTLTDIPTMKKLDSSVNVDTEVSQAISQSPNIWSDQQAVTSAKLGTELFTFNNKNSSSTFQSAQDAVTIAQNQVQVDTDSMDKSVRSLFYSIKQEEDQYDSLLTQLSTDQATFNTLQAQYDAGMATKAQLVAAQYTLAKDKNSQLSLILAHDNNVWLLNKPWAGSGSGGKSS